MFGIDLKAMVRLKKIGIIQPKGKTLRNRFDYVAYDEQSKQMQEAAKSAVQDIETLIRSIGHSEPAASARAIAIANTKLEECYMWIGKAVRDDQIARNGAAELQEGRTNS